MSSACPFVTARCLIDWSMLFPRGESGYDPFLRGECGWRSVELCAANNYYLPLGERQVRQKVTYFCSYRMNCLEFIE